MRAAPWMLAGLLLPSLASGQGSKPALDPFNELFSTACVQHYLAPERLQALMDANGIAPMDAAATGQLLQGRRGMAWSVPLASGRYAVAYTEDGVCAVYAEKADVPPVQKGFARLVQGAPAPMQLRAMPGSGPATPGLVAVSYAWAGPADSKAFVFTLTTAQQPEAAVQAMASMTQRRLDGPR